MRRLFALAALATESTNEHVAKNRVSDRLISDIGQRTDQQFERLASGAIILFMSAPIDSATGASHKGPEDYIAAPDLERFLAVSRHFNPLSLRRSLIVFLVGLGLICGATAFIGAVPTRINGHDIFVPLEVGWRVINGQRPHVDFTSAYGPLLFLVSAMGRDLASLGEWDWLWQCNSCLHCWNLGLFLGTETDWRLFGEQS